MQIYKEKVILAKYLQDLTLERYLLGRVISRNFAESVAELLIFLNSQGVLKANCFG